MTTASTGARPRYLLVAERIIDDIQNGVYPIGSMLPTEARICRLYDVSRITARSALGHVQSLGLIARRQGVGSTVIADQLAHDYVQSLASIDDIFQYARATRLHPVRMETVEADAALAQTLTCQEGQRFLFIAGIRSVAIDAGSRPICWTEIHIADAFAGIRASVAEHDGALASLIERRYGITIAEISQEITPARLDTPTAQALDAQPDSLALCIVRRYHDRHGRVFEMSRNLHPADRFTYTMRLTRRD